MALRPVTLSPFPARVSLVLETETWFPALGESGRGLVSLRGSTGVDCATFFHLPLWENCRRCCDLCGSHEGSDTTRPRISCPSPSAFCLVKTQLPRAAPSPPRPSRCGGFGGFSGWVERLAARAEAEASLAPKVLNVASLALCF